MPVADSVLQALLVKKSQQNAYAKPDSAMPDHKNKHGLVTGRKVTEAERDKAKEKITELDKAIADRKRKLASGEVQPEAVHVEVAHAMPGLAVPAAATDGLPHTVVANTAVPALRPSEVNEEKNARGNM